MLLLQIFDFNKVHIFRTSLHGNFDDEHLLDILRTKDAQVSLGMDCTELLKKFISFKDC